MCDFSDECTARTGSKLGCLRYSWKLRAVPHVGIRTVGKCMWRGDTFFRAGRRHWSDKKFE
ncbi:unnamed protein product [Periconia digitata]|uniref:Uncharacterized protein n=1 Tax=Periconia digitata TaxID=1303443 RepID=A0A9W4U619_9PLEO|nr:unnamed protein product [Periconia digitata]